MAKKKKRIKGNPCRILTVDEDPAGNNSQILRAVCNEVENIDKDIQQICADLRETLFRNQALGLAAPQIGHTYRIITIQTGKNAMTLINPEIVKYEKECNVYDTESCLSVPGREKKLYRYPGVVVKGYLTDGTFMEFLRFFNTTARCIQHELDHLNGILITD